jgi:hypothetical protein
VTRALTRCNVWHVSESASAVARDLRWWSLLRRIRGYFADRFHDVSRTEAWGYAVWGAMGVVIAVPEVWAAIGGETSRWPTISTTIGHLEERWPIVALAPVALIAGLGYQLLRYKPAVLTVQADLQGLGRTPEGRLAKVDFETSELQQTTDREMIGRGRQEISARRYFTVVTILIALAWTFTAMLDERFLVGYVLYSLIAVFWILVPNALAYWWGKDVPFTTLFFTMRQLDGRLHFVSAVVLALLAILLLHLAFHPWPSLGHR